MFHKLRITALLFSFSLHLTCFIVCLLWMPNTGIPLVVYIVSFTLAHSYIPHHTFTQLPSFFHQTHKRKPSWLPLSPSRRTRFLRSQLYNSAFIYYNPATYSTSVLCTLYTVKGSPLTVPPYHLIHTHTHPLFLLCWPPLNSLIISCQDHYYNYFPQLILHTAIEIIFKNPLWLPTDKGILVNYHYLVDKRALRLSSPGKAPVC